MLTASTATSSQARKISALVSHWDWGEALFQSIIMEKTDEYGYSINSHACKGYNCNLCGVEGTLGGCGNTGSSCPSSESLHRCRVLRKEVMSTCSRRGQQRMRWFTGITNSMDMSLSKPQELVMNREAWRAAVHRVTRNQIPLSDRTDWTSSLAEQAFLNTNCGPAQDLWSWSLEGWCRTRATPTGRPLNSHRVQVCAARHETGR